MDGSRPSRRDGQDDGGSTLLFEEIHCPGAYVCHWNGDLLRVADGTMDPESRGPEPPADDEPRYVTMISDNPFIPLARARMIAANLDLEISC